MENNTDYSTVISDLLGDPETMGNVMRIAQKLMNQQSNDFSPDKADKSDNNDHKDLSVENSDKSDNKVADFIESNTNKGRSKNVFESLTGQLNDKENAKNRERLLIALKPYLNTDRQNILDTILKLMKLMQFADIGKFFDGMK